MNTSKEPINVKVLEFPEMHVAFVRKDVYIHDSDTFEKMFRHLFN
jgi:hypothetical protein